jgi:uncharacterized protein (TIGR00299 family) protein
VTRIAWFHCFSGIAGDMALGALLDAGAPVEEVEGWCRRLDVGGWALRTERVLRAGIAGTRAVVEVEGGRRHPHRPARQILQLIADAGLPGRAAERATSTFRRLAEVEGRLHGVAAAEVEFHEVGGVDSIVDIVGVCMALELLGIDRVEASAVAQGTGTFRSSHGVLPNPPPAVMALLSGAGAPAYGLDLPVELTTPTGAALLATLVERFGPLPAMTVRASGFGAGGRELAERPNHVQVVVGEPRETATPGDTGGEAGQPAVVLEATVDDVTGETLAYAVSRLLAEGAFDAWLVPVVMKKGRPGHVVTVLADPAAAERLRRVLREETGTFGVRAHGVQRWPSARHFDVVDLGGHPVRVKVATGRAKAEHDDVAAAAGALGLPLRDVAARVEDLWRAAQAESEGATVAGEVVQSALDPTGTAGAVPPGAGPEGAGPEDGGTAAADGRDDSARHKER